MNIKVPEFDPKKLSELGYGEMFLHDDGDIYIKVESPYPLKIAVNLHNGKLVEFEDEDVLWLENVTINGNKLRRE